MKVVILAAGQGRRLLPWTHDLPKCLLPFAGRPLLGWQLSALAANGVEHVVVVTGFAGAEVERAIERLAPPGMLVTPLYNPFFAVTDNIASCWAAREHLQGEVAVLNGDTLFEPAVLQRVRAEATLPLTITVDIKDSYDADDMKVTLVDGKVARIGKTLAPEASSAESIGLLLLRGAGGQLFVQALEQVMRQPRGVSRWYLSAVDDLASRGVVGAVSIAGLGWAEVDYPGDLGRAEMLARGWVHRERQCVPSASSYPLPQ